MGEVVAYKSLKAMENSKTITPKKWSQPLMGGGLLQESEFPNIGL